MAAGFGGAAMGGGIAGMLMQAGMGIGQTLGNYYIARKQSSRARRFAREVMTNRYQWMVSDLQKAGLNPMLAVASGQGPGVTSAPIVGAQAARTGDVVASARMGALLGTELRRAKAEAAVTEQEALNRTEVWNLLDKQQRTETLRAEDLASQIWFRAKQAGLVSAQEKESIQRAIQTFISSSAQATQLPGLKTEEEIDKTQYGRALRYLDRGVRAITPIKPRK